jgi:hypothetical protein
MATMVEVPLRRLTNLPTVARASAGDIRPVGRIPTRASDPRTEITRPKEIAEVELSISLIAFLGRLLLLLLLRLLQAVTAKTVKPDGIGITVRKRSDARWGCTAIPAYVSHCFY